MAREARRCFRCGVIVAWLTPPDIEILDNWGIYGSKYCCKDCAKKLMGEKDGKQSTERGNK